MIRKTTVFAIFIASLTIFPLGETFAQPKVNKTPQPKPKAAEKSSATADFNNTPKWYVTYAIFIKGDGGEVIRDGETKFWRIKRSYIGQILLEKRMVTPPIPASVFNLPNISSEDRQKIQEGLGQLNKPGSIEWQANPNYFGEVNQESLMTIDDEVEKVTLITGSPGSWTRKTITQTWNGKGFSEGSVRATFYPDLSNLSFRLNLPLFVVCQEQVITYTKLEKGQQSQYGNGSPKPDPPPVTEKI